MDHLFLVRHGPYFDDNLTEEGAEKIWRLTELMKGRLENPSASHYLFTSSSPRARQTADVISQAFGLPSSPPRDPCLWVEYDDDLPPELLAHIDRLIQPPAAQHDIVTVVAHLTPVRCYFDHVKHDFGLVGSLYRGEYQEAVRMGEAIHLDRKRQRFAVLQPW